MITFRWHHHQAEVDDDGNIVVPPDGNQDVWEYTDTDNTVDSISTSPLIGAKKFNLLSLRSSALKRLQSMLSESSDQYHASMVGGKCELHTLSVDTTTILRRTWAQLNQPVWIVRPNKEPKECSRIRLFVFDTVRFGGTFAAIFVALFVTFNYQSFWEIVTTRINPVEHARTTQALTASVDAKLKEKLLRSPSLAVSGNGQADMLSFLPDVGPPENRLIIPKLGLNVPLVTPAYDSLLREDWIQVEKDIQEALQMGVVHYPGTAKAGQAGNFFITGHSSYYPWAPGEYKNVFARLHEMNVGDEYWVYYGGDKHRYIIREKKEVSPSNVTVLDQPVDRRISTLMTCTPIGTTLRRLIISSEEVDPATGIALGIGEKGKRSMPSVQATMLPI